VRLNGGTKQFAESDKRCERTPGQKVALLFGATGGNTWRAGDFGTVSAEEHERLRKAAAAVWVPTRANECLPCKRWWAQGKAAGEVEGKAL